MATQLTPMLAFVRQCRKIMESDSAEVRGRAVSENRSLVVAALAKFRGPVPTSKIADAVGLDYEVCRFQLRRLLKAGDCIELKIGVRRFYSAAPL